jgi:sulfatase maturation enzyme AslB (radical SAM superfamily)
MLKDTFCSSPWFHVRVTYDGSFEKCRWVKSSNHTSNIQQTSLLQYFTGEEMNQFRSDFVQGKSVPDCATCYYQDQFGKVSGRQKQLLKSAVRTDDFTNSLLSSPHREDFIHSNSHNGATTRAPTDLQIDLGNLCNSACIMCDPVASSRLTQDYNKLSQRSSLFVKPVNYQSWTENDTVLSTLLKQITDVKYIHLLGGETLYNQAFYKICNHLINSGNSAQVIMGTTTNGTIYTTELEQIIPQFEEFHLGISIETVSKLNDYVRYPSDIQTVLANIDRFIALRERYTGLHLTLRITPNLFTVYEIDQLFEYMIARRITAESCNILHKPECLRMELLPKDIRSEVIEKLENLINKYSLTKHHVTNVRNPHLVDQVNADTIIDYVEFLKNYQEPDNRALLEQQLVEFLKSFESLRNNSILDYAPRYTDFLRRIGY